MKIHMVKKGDTLYSIAQKYGVDLDKLIAFNSQIADPDKIDVGMKVKIPSTPVPVPPPVGEILHKHTVVQGDSLWKLSKEWDVPLKAVIDANPHLKNPNVLMTGDIVYIPKIGTETPHESVTLEAEQTMEAETASMMPPGEGEAAEMVEMPEAAEMPEMVETAETVEMPEMAAMPAMPAMPGMPGMPVMPEMPVMDGMSGMVTGENPVEWMAMGDVSGMGLSQHMVVEPGHMHMPPMPAVHPFMQMNVPAAEAMAPPVPYPAHESWMSQPYGAAPSAALSWSFEGVMNVQQPAEAPYMPMMPEQLPMTLPIVTEKYPGIPETAAAPCGSMGWSMMPEMHAQTLPAYMMPHPHAGPCKPCLGKAYSAAMFNVPYALSPDAYPSSISPHADWMKNGWDDDRTGDIGPGSATEEKAEEHTRAVKKKATVSARTKAPKRKSPAGKSAKKQNVPWIRV